MSASSRRRAGRCRPSLEVLEDRAVPASLEFADTNAYFTRLTNPSVAYTPASASSVAGGRVAAWVEGSGSTYHVVAAFSGTARINVATAGPGARPAVAMDGSGGFVVAWATPTNDILAARYTRLGERTGPVVSVAAHADAESEPGVAMNAAGAFVVTYTRRLPAGNTIVIARRFDAASAPLGITYVANQAGSKASQAVVARAGGPLDVYAVAYQKDGDIRLSRYRADGSLIAAAIIAKTTKVEFAPTLAIDVFGNCVVGWQERTSGTTVTLRVSRVSAGQGIVTLAFSTSALATTASSMAVAMDRFDGSFYVAFRDVNPTTKKANLKLSQQTNGGSGGMLIDSEIPGNAVVALSTGNHRALLAFIDLDATNAQRVAYRVGQAI